MGTVCGALGVRSGAVLKIRHLYGFSGRPRSSLRSNFSPIAASERGDVVHGGDGRGRNAKSRDASGSELSRAEGKGEGGAEITTPENARGGGL